MSKAAELAEFGGGISGGTDAVSGMAKGWCNFQARSTFSVRDSFNAASVTDNETGSFTYNFSTNMSDADYAASGMTNRDSTTSRGMLGLGFSRAHNDSGGTNPSSSAFPMTTRQNSNQNDAGLAVDPQHVTIQFNGDLA